MGLTEKEIGRIKDELINCKRPVFLFHDDADGLCSFLLLYRFVKEGKGIIVKSRPAVDEKFIRKVMDYEADKVFILDVPIAKQEFFDGVKIPVIWIDHHSPANVENVLYFNPRIHKRDIIYPVTNICYDIVMDDLWIAMTGCIGDWHIPSFKDEFCDKYPELMDKNITEPGRMLFETMIGKLANIFNFILKGSMNDTMKCVKVLTRIKSPYDILYQESAQGRFIFQRYEKINKIYEKLLNDAGKNLRKNDKFMIYTYADNKMSFTGELSNELLYRHPDKIIIVAREKSGEMRMSLRSRDVVLPTIIEKSLIGLDGYGGGHEHACGACVKKEGFTEFVERLRREIQ